MRHLQEQSSSSSPPPSPPYPTGESCIDNIECDKALNDRLTIHLANGSPYPPWQGNCHDKNTLISIGVLTLPVLIRSKQQRTYHRAAHYVQAPVQQGRVCFKYVVTDAEIDRVSPSLKPQFLAENKTYGDMVEVPAVPYGPLRRQLASMGLYCKNSEDGNRKDGPCPAQLRDAPIGAGCVLKILSWLQRASRLKTPFVAYADDDTYFSFTRLQQMLQVFQPSEAYKLRMYAGAMQYHAWWDFSVMKCKGWHFTMAGAANQWQKEYSMHDAMPYNASAEEREDAAHLFHRPYPMAHGLGVVLSHALAKGLPSAPEVGAFLRLHKRWLDDSVGGKQLRRAVASGRGGYKCFLGTDSTFASWIRAYAVNAGSWRESSNSENGGGGGGVRTSRPTPSPFVAIDVLNFNMNWPWPLPGRVSGNHSEVELHDMTAMHLYGAAAREARHWMHLHRKAILPHEQEARNASSEVVRGAAGARLYCRHAADGNASKAVLERWIEQGTARWDKPLIDEKSGTVLPASAQHTRFYTAWLTRHHNEVANGQRKRHAVVRLDPPDWLYCTLSCLEEGRMQGKRCQRGWPDLRRTRK